MVCNYTQYYSKIINFSISQLVNSQAEIDFALSLLQLLVLACYNYTRYWSFGFTISFWFLRVFLYLNRKF